MDVSLSLSLGGGRQVGVGLGAPAGDLRHPGNGSRAPIAWTSTQGAASQHRQVFKEERGNRISLSVRKLSRWWEVRTRG